MLLHRVPGGGLISKEKLMAPPSPDVVNAVEEEMIWNSTPQESIDKIQMGELSSARQALEGAEVAPGIGVQHIVSHFPQIADHVPATRFELNASDFAQTCTGQGGVRSRPLRMMTEHLRTLLDDNRASRSFERPRHCHAQT